LWIGQVISEIGDWLNNIAVLALTIELADVGHEGRAIAVYAIARHLPLFLFGPIAGVVVDRVNRQRVMIVADFARAFFALGFLLANVMRALPAIYFVGAALFSISAFFNAAKRASIPNIAHNGEELLSANSLSAATTATTIAVGSALGGIIATFTGRNFVFVLNALTFLASANMIWRIRGRLQQRDCDARTQEDDRRVALNFVGRAAQALRQAAHDFREGLRYVKNDFVLAAIFIVAAGWGLGNGAARALYSLFGARLGQEAATGLVARPMDLGISGLFVAMGFGGMIGGPIARRFNQAAGDRLGTRMGRSLLFDGSCLAVFAFVPTLLGASLVLIVREINFAIWWTAQQTIIMGQTEDRFSGRVFASFETLTTLMMVASMLISGVAADTYGIKLIAATGGIIIACSGLIWFILKWRARRRRPSDGAKVNAKPFQLSSD
jgi:MFS family permease